MIPMKYKGCKWIFKKITQNQLTQLPKQNQIYKYAK